MKFKTITRLLCVTVCICCAATFVAPLDAEAYSYYTKAKPVLTVKVSDSENAATLSWTKVKGATGYKVYRSANGGKYKLIKTTTKRTYKNSKLKTEYPYRYKVKAYKKTVKYVKVKGKKKKQKRTYYKYSRYCKSKYAKVRSSYRDKKPELTAAVTDDLIVTFTITKNIYKSSKYELQGKAPDGEWETLETKNLKKQDSEGNYIFKRGLRDGWQYRIREIRTYTYGKYTKTVHTKWSSSITTTKPAEKLPEEGTVTTSDGTTFQINWGKGTSTTYVNSYTGSAHLYFTPDHEINTEDLEYIINNGNIEVDGLTACVTKDGTLMGETEDGDGYHDMPGYTEVIAYIPSWEDKKGYVCYGCDPFSRTGKHQIFVSMKQKGSIPITVKYKGEVIYDGIIINETYEETDETRLIVDELEQKYWTEDMSNTDKIRTLTEAIYTEFAYDECLCSDGARMVYYAAKDLGLHPRNVFPCAVNTFLHHDYYCYGATFQTSIGGHVEVAVDTNNDGIEEWYAANGH